MSNKSVRLNTQPHYTDQRFKKGPLTVFGNEEKGLRYEYSDRIWQWDYQKAEASAKAANESGYTNMSANWYEVYLSSYFDEQVELIHVLAGVNRSNGFPYAVFGFKAKHDTD